MYSILEYIKMGNFFQVHVHKNKTAGKEEIWEVKIRNGEGHSIVTLNCNDYY